MNVREDGAPLETDTQPSSSSDDQRIAHLAMLVFTLLISTSFTIGAAITHALDPVPLTFLRFVLASLIFAGLLTATKDWSIPSTSDTLRYGTIGFLLVVYFVTMFEALRWSGAISLSAVFTLAPLTTALISYFLLNQRIGKTLALGLIIAACGAVWVVFDGSVANLLQFSIGKGEAIFFVGCVAYSAYSPAIRKLHRGESIMALTFWTLAAGTVMLGVYGFRAIVAADWSTLPLSVYGGIVYLATATTAVSFFLIKYASIHLPSAKVMAYTYLIPAFVGFQIALLGGGWPTISVLAGIAVIAAGTFILQRS